MIGDVSVFLHEYVYAVEHYGDQENLSKFYDVFTNNALIKLCVRFNCACVCACVSTAI